MFVHGTTFQVLVQDLLEGESLLFKVRALDIYFFAFRFIPILTLPKNSFLDLINGTLATIHNFQDRELIREIYVEFGITSESLQVIAASFLVTNFT
jgi:hypothetical protein